MTKFTRDYVERNPYVATDQIELQHAALAAVDKWIRGTTRDLNAFPIKIVRDAMSGALVRGEK